MNRRIELVANRYVVIDDACVVGTFSDKESALDALQNRAGTPEAEADIERERTLDRIEEIT